MTEKKKRFMKGWKERKDYPQNGTMNLDKKCEAEKFPFFTSRFSFTYGQKIFPVIFFLSAHIVCEVLYHLSSDFLRMPLPHIPSFHLIPFKIKI